MENDTPNPTTNQLLIQHISEAALLTDPDFAITACNSAALALFLYNQQDILGQSLSFLLSAASNTSLTAGIIAYTTGTGKIIKLQPGLPHVPVDNVVATSLFRIYQEALTNIARHANAKTVFSKLQVENQQVILTIIDDGAGFDMQTLAIKKTLGLPGIKERTLMMGGRFEIISKPGEGTTIVVTTLLQDTTAKSKTDQ